jgi:hypothetical protein
MKAIAGMVFALALAGCATTNPASPGLKDQVFEDLPSPEGLKYESGYGHKSPGGDIRTYDQTYTGSRRIEDVRKFYEEKLPFHGWSQKGAEGTDPVVLTFEKRAEKCVVSIGSSRTKLKVTVKVSGKS